VPQATIVLVHGAWADIASFVAQRTSGPVVLVGHSYGGFVTTNAAAGGDLVR
jgi:pimeloyl-ACP methyl ester carboxylesterase